MNRGVLRRLRLTITVVLLLVTIGGVPGSGPEVPAVAAQTPSASPEPAAPPRKPTEPRNVEVVGQVSGEVEVLVIEGRYAYVGQGRRLVILDLADPVHPRVVGSAGGHADDVLDIEIEGEYAYVAAEAVTLADNAGIRVVRISDPSHPVEVGFFPTPGNIRPLVAVHGTTGYVGGQTRDITMVDFSDPTNPKDLGPGEPPPAAPPIQGRYHWGIHDKQLQILDRSDPANPSVVGAMPFATSLEDSELVGSTLYLLANKDASALDVVDVSDPTQPRSLGHVDFTRERFDSMTVSGDRVYLTSRFYRTFTVVDVSDPTRPAVLGSAKTGMGPPQRTIVVGDYAYVIAVDGGLRIFSVADGAHPTEVGAFEGPASGTGTLGVAVSDGYAYIADSDNGVWTVRVDDPARPVLLGHYDEEHATALRVAARGHYVFLLQSGTLEAPNELVVLDMADPTLPKRVAAIELTALVGNDLVLTDSYLYLATSASLRVIDVSDPTAPHEVGSYVLPLEESGDSGPVTARYSRIAVNGNLVYMASTTQKRQFGTNTPYAIRSGSGLSVIDVSSPQNPFRVAYVQDTWDVDAVGVVGSHLYVLADESGPPSKDGIHIFDLADPIAPAKVGFLQMTTAGFSHNVVQDGRYAYVSSSSLHVLDTADPANPVEVADSWPITVNGLAVVDGLAYAGAGDEGLAILRFIGAP